MAEWLFFIGILIAFCSTSPWIFCVGVGMMVLGVLLDESARR